MPDTVFAGGAYVATPFVAMYAPIIGRPAAMSA